VWHLLKGKYTARYDHAHTHAVQALTFCGGRLISADMLHLKEWSPNEKDERRDANVRSAGRGVVVTRDGSLAATVVDGGELTVFDLRAGSVELTLPAAPCAEASDRTYASFHRKTIRAANSHRVLSSIGNRMSVWDLDTRAAIASREVNNLGEVALTPDGRGVVYGDGVDLFRWEPDSGALIRLGSHEGNARDIAVSPSGRLALTPGGDRRVSVWDLRRRRTRRPDANLKRVWPEARDKPSKVTFVDDTHAVVGTGDGSVFVFDPRDGNPAPTYLGTHGFPVWHVVATENGLAVTGSYRGLTVWDIPGRRRVAELGEIKGNVLQLSLHGDRLLIATEDGVLKLVSLNDVHVIASFQADKQLVACSADDEFRWFAAHDEDGLMHFLHLER